MKEGYMNIKKNLLIVSLLFTMIPLDAMETKKHIVIDLEGFLVEPDTKAAISSLGWWSVVSKGLGALNLQTDFFNALHKIASSEVTTPTTETIMWKEQPAPPAIHEFLTGKKKCSILIEEVKKGIKALHLSDEKLMLSLVDITFNPKKNAGIMQLIPEGVKLLEEFVQRNHTVHLVANWNSEALTKLQEQFRNIFKLINGQIIVSGEVGKVKGPELCKELYRRASIKSEDCIFLETDQRHIDILTSHAQQEKKPKPQTILCSNKDFTVARSQLTSQGILSSLNKRNTSPQRRQHKKNDSLSQVSQLMSSLPTPVMVPATQ